MKGADIKAILFICICVLFMVVWLPDVFAAKPYRMTSVSIDAQLQTDTSTDYSLGTGIVILAGVEVYFIGIWAIILGVVSITVSIPCFLTLHRTKEAEMLARHWNAFKNV